MVRTKKEGHHLVAYLQGEIDHCAADSLRKELEEKLRDQAILHLTLDFSSVSFMDSSGIGMLIGRYKTLAARGGTVSARHLNAAAAKLFYMAGLHRIITVEQEEKQA